MKFKKETAILITVLVVSFTDCMAQKVSGPTKANKQNISTTMFTCPWDVGESVLECAITQFKDKSGENIRRLSIHPSEGEKRIHNYVFETPDYPVAIFPTSDLKGLLVTIWTGGSSYKIKIFHFTEEHINLVLDTGSRTFPEFVFLDKFTSFPDLITVNSFLFAGEGNLMEPDSAEIVRWNGEHYVVVAKVPWKERLQPHHRN